MFNSKANQNLGKSVENFDDLVLVDRSLLHGDVVAMLSDPYGQTGTIVDVGMFLCPKLILLIILFLFF